MVDFWDSSALVPLVVGQTSSPVATTWYERCGEPMIWTLTPIEIHSAICRLLRNNKINTETFDQTCLLWKEMEQGFLVIKDINPVKQRAKRLLQAHALKAADSLQLAAALVATEDNPENHHFFTFDRALAAIAKKEGFTVPTLTAD